MVEIGDINGTTEWDQALEGVTRVIHLAARVYIMNDRQDALAQSRTVNAQGTKQLAESAAKGNIQRFVYISSIKVNYCGLV